MSETNRTSFSIAALYDIHANLPALDAVLDEIERLGIDRIVVGGDVLPGPMPREALNRLLNLDAQVHFIVGNGELAVLAQMDATDDPSTVKYWGTRTGEPLPEPLRPGMRWIAQQLGAPQQEILASWPKTFRLTVDSLGEVLFCHGTPRSELETFTRLTPEEQLLPAFEGLGVDVVVCGHTHMQFDRKVGTVRVINAGSVGMPFQQPPAAYWLLLGPDVQLRRTAYDSASAAKQIRSTGYPQAEDFAVRYVLDSPSEADMLERITAVSFR